ncbi:ATP-grasp domain-containing protein [Denitrobacterium detoxificans]|jgi:hypothetical protein|uniref:ATP-grasp domain-containing protein n=1 Tax=Denitrobacterium detoxificans TaxID=79604 RepID=UPI0026F13B12|nr:ATP-grasp domain-containing protein [Denitrobacterium detoxificans]MBE6466670.1 ATP-grasp domain-containing protein [Denitrobacterium detoxificans]
MFILEGPYASDIMLDWLEASQHPTLGNAFAREVTAKGRTLNLVDPADAAARIDAGERVYSSSESALEWVLANVHDEHLLRCIRLCKDKAETRRALATVDPTFFFRECTMEELLAIDPGELPFPLVVKPAAGFISFGVHVVRKASDWDATINLLREEMTSRNVHPSSVVTANRFIIEGYLSGQEYAVDLYFNGEGEPVILNVLQHDFRDAADTSDHLYFTSPHIIRSAAPALRRWFQHANETFRFRNYCLHAEIRVRHAPQQDPIEAFADPANVHVIELNPLRFAGLCGTDVGYYAFGIRTYAYYLANQKPDWESVLAERSTSAATGMGVLETPPNWKQGCRIDYDKIEQGVTLNGALDNLCELRPMNPDTEGAACFPLFRIPAGEQGKRVRDFMLGYNANDYLISR